MMKNIKKVSDLPEDQQKNYVDFNDGFVSKGAADYLEEKKIAADNENSNRGLVDKILGKNKLEAVDLMRGSAAGEHFAREHEKRTISLKAIEEEKVEFANVLSREEEIMVPCRNFPSPKYQFARLTKLIDSRSILIKDLFDIWGIPKEKLSDIYGISGFTENGKQILADLLKKKIVYYYSPEQNAIIPDSKKIFEPRT